MSAALHVLLADDHPLTRQGVISVLRHAFADARFDEVSSAGELFARIGVAAPDVVILDLSLPDRHGLDCLGELARRHPAVPVLILSMHAEDTFALRALDLGAMGYLTKDRASEEIVGAVKRIRSGRRYISSDLAETLAMQRNAPQALPHEALSAREFRVLRELARGEPLISIADRLALSPKTVTTYRARILTKLGLANNAELVRYCIEHGLVE
ncbi:MAG: response regulator transcription factor [Proteobacteria bacterium]|nr:response regulator transcription factor [Pseudomonadota bacterium]